MNMFIYVLLVVRLNGQKLKAVNYLSCISRDVSNNDLCGTIPTSGPFEHIPLNK